MTSILITDIKFCLRANGFGVGRISVLLTQCLNGNNNFNGFERVGSNVSLGEIGTHNVNTNEMPLSIFSGVLTIPPTHCFEYKGTY